MENRDGIIKLGVTGRKPEKKQKFFYLLSCSIKPADILYWSDYVFIASCSLNQRLAYSKDLQTDRFRQKKIVSFDPDQHFGWSYCSY